MKRQPGKAKSVIGEVTVHETMAEIEKDRVFYEQSGGGVTLSGGEPLLQGVFAQELLSACRDRGIHTAVDTSGYVPWDSFEKVLPVTNLFLYDLKLLEDEKHIKYTGVSNSLILENLSQLHDKRGNIIVRIPLIPSVTDTLDNLEKIRDTIAVFSGIHEIHLLPYNPLAEDKYRRWGKKFRLNRCTPQTPEDIERMKQIFAGMEVKIEVGG